MSSDDDGVSCRFVDENKIDRSFAFCNAELRNGSIDMVIMGM